MYVNVDSRRPVKLIEGWLEHMSEDRTWKRYWCVLTGETIVFFNNQNASNEFIVGSIALDQESRLEKLDGEDRSGYKFIIRTRQRLNRFKASKITDREHWKAYVEGIAFGKLSGTIDLLPGQIEEIRKSLQQYFSNRSQIAYPKTSIPAVTDLKDGWDTPESSTSGSYKSNVDTLDYLVPSPLEIPPAFTQPKHKFYSDSRPGIPNWYFTECSRELAIKILTVGAAYGNTLMRESTNDSKKLAISKRIESGSTGQDFTHYMVLCTPRGYKIDVENNHEPMQTLSEVMEFFLDTSGRKTALPMKCNDLTILGINDPADNDYNRRIVTIKQDADSGEEMVDTGTNEMYCLPTEKGPPDVIAPPPPHVNKKEIKQQTINDPHDRWNMRSISVPNINHEGVEQVQSARFPQAPIPFSGPQNSPGMRTIIDAKLEGLHDQSRRTWTIFVSSTDLANIPPLGPPSSQVATPPLPPNHPSLFKKTHSQSAMISSQDNIPANVKRTVPKHSKSVSSVDVQVRKTSPRDQHSTSQARDELSQISRINKQKEMPDGTLKLKGNVIRSELEEEEKILSPVSSDSFKKELGGILENQIKQGPGQRLKTRNTSPPRDYDPFAHYKNANEIYNARK